MKAEDEDIAKTTATTIPEDGEVPPVDEEVSSPADDMPPKVTLEIMDTGQEQKKSEEEKPKPFSKMCHFRKFTEKTYEELVIRETSDKLKAQQRRAKGQTARLVDGDLRFGDEDEEEHILEPDPLLHEGNTLTENYGVFPTPYCGWPIEEIDQGIKDKTFVVISRRVTKKTIYRFSATRSFYIFPPWNPIRKMAVFVSTNQFFDYFVILTILTNCVFLALPTMTFTESSEFVFLGIYTLEMFIKLIARGFFINNYTYLRDPWNWLDFVVIVIAYVTTIIQAAAPGFSVGNLTSLRTFRVFRALKTVSIIPGLKTIVGALLRAFKMLIEVIMLTVFCLMVFALFALQVYMGGLRQKCVLNYNITQSDSMYVTHYSEHIRNSSNWFTDGDGGYLLCGNITGSGGCPSNYTCLPDIGENPNSGYTNFDHFGWAMLNAFQLITLDFWEDTYNKVIRASGPWNLVFFIVVIFFGSFYLINLMLAVVAMSYEEEAVRAGKEREREKASQRKKMNQNPIYDITRISIASKKLKLDEKKNPKDKKSGLKKTEIKGAEGLKQPEKKPRPPVNPKKPMVKIPSKDSGYSSRSQNSSRSVGSRVLKHRDSRERLKNPEDAETDSEASSSVNYAFKSGMLIKQNSRGNVSSSGVILERESTVSELNSLEENKETSVVIIKADEDPDIVPGPNELVDRNCKCCHSCCKCFIPLLRAEGMVYAFISDPLFDLFITISIVLNTIIMALEQHGQSEQMNVLIKVANYVFTAVFIFEAVLKLFALNKYYFKSGWNIFDLIIVVASIIDLGFEEVDGLSVFRTFRLLRVFKLAQSWPTMRILLSIILSTLGALGNLTIVLAIIIYIFAVTGLQLFMSTYTPEKFAPDPPPRWNFNNIQHALMMIFRVLCGEWIEPLWACMKANNELCMVVFLPALVLGYFIVLNLFLALLLNAFATDSIRKHKETNQEESRLKLAWERIRGLCCCCLGKNINAIEPKKNGKASGEDSTNVIDIDENGKEIKNADADADADAKPSTNGVSTKSEDTKKTQSNGSVKSQHVKEAQAAFDTSQKRAQFSSFEEARQAEAERKKNGVDEDGLALGDTASSLKKNEVVVFNCMPKILAKRMPWLSKYDQPSRWYSMRRCLIKVADNKIFETAVLLVIFASSVTLAFEDVTLDEKPSLKLALYYLNIIFCILFSVEMLIKMFGYGLHKYFTSFWTILDFCIVLISIVSLIAESLGVSNIAAFRSLRTLRAIRPLRAISRWQGMKIVVNALMLAIPAIVNVILVCLVFWLIFSIMGVQFFSGKFFKCVDANLERIDASIIANRSECEANSHMNYTWRNSHINFDNVLQGYLALFQVATFEGWMEVMIDAVDATEIDVQPREENNFAAYLYFVGFIIFGAFFTLNLLIGVIIDNFNMLKKKYEGSYLDMFLTSSQRNYYNTLKKLGNKKPQKTIKRPKKQFAAFFYDVSISNKFELAIVLIIFLNMIVMGIEHYNQSDAVSQVLDIMNIIFTTVFTLEALVKLVGLRWHYFRQAWNVFDFIIVILSILGVVLDDLLSDVFVTPTLLRVVRIFRIGRVLRLIKAAKGIRKLLFALIISLPAIFNIGALLFLVLYIYAIIGLSSFGNLKINGALDDIVNFRTFFNSFMLLLRLATSAGWNDILDAMLISPPDCDPEFKTLPNGTLVKETYGDCGIPWLAIPFMVSYIIIIFLVIINMYIAVILENFNQAHEQEEVGITEDDFDMFYVVWERYDPHATQFIKYEQLTDFVADLDEPFGIAKPNEIALVSFDLPIVEGDKLHCLDILMALVKNVLSDVEETAEFREVKNQMEEKFQTVFPSRVNTVVKSTTMQRKKEEVAARTLQQAWKSFKTQRLLKNITAQAMQQNMSRSSSQDSRSRANSIMSLGRRLSNALTSFFSSSRPSSAVSRASLKSAQNQHFSPIRKKNVSNTLQVPSVNTLYSSSSDLDINHLDL